MAEAGHPETPREKSLLYNWACAFLGVGLGAVVGPMLIGRAVGNPTLATVIGAAAGAAIGWGLPALLKMFGLIKAQ